jgi:heat shock protein HslJ
VRTINSFNIYGEKLMKIFHSKFIFVTGLAAGLFILAACTSAVQPQTGGGDVTGEVWGLTLLNDKAPLAGSSISALFTSGGKLGGSSGCNQYSGSYKITGDSFQITSPLASTMMACSQELMDQETAYLSALNEVKKFSVTGDQLTFSDANNKSLLVYKAQSQDLAGTSWTVIAYNNGKQAVTSVVAGSNITIDFGTDGIVSGTGGCNTYTGSYKVTENQISIGPLASTRMFCGEPAGIMDQETQFLLAMETAATYKIEASTLELRTQDGALAVQAVKSEKVTDAPAASSSIQDINWQWVSVTNQTTGETTTVPSPEKYTIIFNTDGTLEGKADCNNFTGTYTQDNGLVITLGTSTMAYCGDTSLDQQYLTLLGSVVAGGPDGAGGLALENAGGEQRMLFQNGGATK